MFSTNLQNKATTITAILVTLVIIIILPDTTSIQAVNNTKTFSTVQDFTTCASASPTLTNTVITEDDDGEIALEATLEDYFRTSEIVSPTWETGIYATGTPTISVTNGAATIVGSSAGGGYIQSQDPQYLGILEAVVTFSAGQSQHFGWAAPGFSSNHYAIFSTHGTTSKLFVRTNNAGGEIEDLVADPLPTGPQRLRIEWLEAGAGNVEMRYYVNGVLVSTNSPHIVPAFAPNQLHITLSNDTRDALALSADWIRYTHYTTTTSGSYISCPVSVAGNQTQIWGPVSWSPISPPVGSEITVGIQTSMNGSAWLPASPAIVANGGAPIVPDGVYARYTVILTGTTAITDTPKLNSISLGYSPLPSIAINDVTVTEGHAGTAIATFTVSLSAARNQAVTVNYTTADSTATSSSDDYIPASGTVTFPANSATPQTITVQVKGDTFVELDEAFIVNLSTPSGATLADNQGIGTIQNDDSLSTPVISINDISVTEGNAGTSVATFNVTLSEAITQVVTLDYSTANDTAIAPTDYSAILPSVLNFPPGTTTQTITVQIKGENLVEDNETFFVNLSNPSSGVLIADNQGIGSITNDDTTAISVSDSTVTEGNSGTVNVTFTVSLSAPSSQLVTVNYATANNTATAPADYIHIPGTLLSFQPGVVTQTISVQIKGDTLVETDETFFVNLSAASGAMLLDNQGVGTIQDDDSQMRLYLALVMQ